jgi:hypothetical protein
VPGGDVTSLLPGRHLACNPDDFNGNRRIGCRDALT